MRHDSSPSLHLRWGKQWLSLKHSDLPSAKLAARERSAALMTARGVGLRLRLGQLLDMYALQVSAVKKPLQRREDKRRTELWKHWLGASSDPMKLTGDKLKSFERARRAGTVQVPGRKLRVVRNKAIREDLVFLSSVFNWAASMQSDWLLPRNPMQGYELPRELNPKRPVVYHEDFRALAKVAPLVHPLLPGFLALVESLGWRVSSICRLRASDFDPERTKTRPHGRLLKRAETDKVGVERWTIIPKEAGVALRKLVRGKIGNAWLFPAELKAGEPWSRHYARKLLVEAWEKSKVPASRRTGFHAFRRAWVTARQHLPRTLVAAQGAWLSTRTLEIYEVAEEAALLAVAEEPRKVRRRSNA